jgi:PAS domain S-box-containing protein
MADLALTAIRLLDAVALAFVVGLLGIAWTRRGDADARLLFGMLVGVAVWIAGDLLARLPAGAGWTVPNVNAQLTASAVAVAFLFLFVAEYTGRRELLSGRYRAAIAVEPVALTALVWTNGAHGLVYDPSMPGGGIVAGMGPALAAHAVYSYLLVALSLALLVGFLARTNYRYRRQVYAIAAGAVAPLLGNVLYLFGPVPFDLTPVSYAVTGLLLTGAVARADLLRVAPIARTAVVDTAPVGVVVLDGEGRVVDVNPEARRLFDTKERPPVGAGYRTLFDTYPALAASLDDRLPSPGEDEFTVEDDEYAFEVRTTPLSEARGQPVGTLVLIDEVTERVEYERRLERRTERLELLNRVVRHDIRNDMQLSLGYLEALEPHVDEPGREYLETLGETSRHVVELTASVRDLTETMLDGVDPEPVDLRRVLLSEVRAARASHESAVVEVEGEVPDVRVLADDVLGSVFRNLLRNAVQHNDGPTPEVVVSVEDRGDAVAVSVADDGPGIPDDRKEAVFGKGEMGLESEGTGVGLYLVGTLVEGYGGEVRVEDNDPEGSVFTVELPAARAASARPSAERNR